MQQSGGEECLGHVGSGRNADCHCPSRFEASKLFGLKTTADTVWSKMGLPMFTHSVEAHELCSVGVNSGALGLRLEVVDSVAGGDTAASPLVG